MKHKYLTSRCDFLWCNFLSHESLLQIKLVQRWYCNLWSSREVQLLLVENYNQYPAPSRWDALRGSNFLVLDRSLCEFYCYRKAFTFPQVMKYVSSLDMSITPDIENSHNFIFLMARSDGLSLQTSIVYCPLATQLLPSVIIAIGALNRLYENSMVSSGWILPFEEVNPIEMSCQ